MKKRIAFILAATLIAALFLTACVGSTEVQVVADDCLRGSPEACRYHAAIVNSEKADEEKALAKTAYYNKKQPPKESITPTPESKKGGGN